MNRCTRGKAVLALVATVGLWSCNTPRSHDSRTWDAGSAAMPSFAQRLGIQLDEGMTISRLTAVSPGCVLGLRDGDTVVALNGQPVASPAAFEQRASANLQGEYAPWCFTVRREGEQLKLPQNCNHETFATDRLTRDHACDPLSLTSCGPLPGECAAFGN